MYTLFDWAFPSQPLYAIQVRSLHETGGGRSLNSQLEEHKHKKLPHTESWIHIVFGVLSWWFLWCLFAAHDCYHLQRLRETSEFPRRILCSVCKVALPSRFSSNWIRLRYSIFEQAGACPCRPKSDLSGFEKKTETCVWIKSTCKSVKISALDSLDLKGWCWKEHERAQRSTSASILSSIGSASCSGFSLPHLFTAELLEPHDCWERHHGMCLTFTVLFSFHVAHTIRACKLIRKDPKRNFRLR